MAEDDLTLSAVVGANGEATITFKSTNRCTWTVTQFSPEAPNVGGSASAALYLDSQLVSPFVPQGDAVAGDPPVYLRPGRRLQARWFGCLAGTTVKATIYYDDGTGN